MTELQAGAAVVEITPGAGIAMGGYGARQGVSTGMHDPLNVRVLVLADGATRLVLAVCDLVGVPAELVNAARAIIARDTGIPAECVCISATHTHSGPLMQPGTDEGDAYIAVTARKIAGAVQVALARLQPVSLKLATADVRTISQNRRDPNGPIETTVKVLLVAPPAPAPAVATVVNYACHATVLEYDNLLYSADFPGQAAGVVEQALGGACIYMQGTCGDINPAWMRHDFAEIARVGGLLGAAAARVGHELRPLGEGLQTINLSWSEATPTEPAPGTLLSDVRLGAAQRFLDLPRRPLPPLDEIEREMAALEQKLAAAPDDVATRRAVRPRLNQLRMDRAQKQRDPAQPGDTERVELQAFRISAECAVAMLPGEFFVEIGHGIEQAAGMQHLLLCGYANAAIGYIATADQFPHCGYEVGRTRFQPETAAIVIRESAALVRSLYA
jgi:neutral ceramidase